MITCSYVDVFKDQHSPRDRVIQFTWAAVYCDLSYHYRYHILSFTSVHIIFVGKGNSADSERNSFLSKFSKLRHFLEYPYVYNHRKMSLDEYKYSPASMHSVLLPENSCEGFNSLYDFRTDKKYLVRHLKRS